jgi:hypothetical protein
MTQRFLLGHPLDGRRYSDGTFWRRGTKRVGHQPYVFTWDWWTLAAGWQRSALRLAAVAVALVVAVAVIALLGR